MQTPLKDNTHYHTGIQQNQKWLLLFNLDIPNDLITFQPFMLHYNKHKFPNEHSSLQPFNLEFTNMTELKNGDNDSLLDVAAQLEYVLVLGTRHKVSLAVEFTEFQCNVKPESAFFCNERAVRQNTRRLWQTTECSCKAVQKLRYVLHSAHTTTLTSPSNSLKLSPSSNELEMTTKLNYNQHWQNKL